MSKECRARGWLGQESGRPLGESRVYVSDWGQRSEGEHSANGRPPQVPRRCAWEVGWDHGTGSNSGKCAEKLSYLKGELAGLEKGRARGDPQNSSWAYLSGALMDVGAVR